MKHPQAVALGVAILVAGTGAVATSQSTPVPSTATPDSRLSAAPEETFVDAVQRANDNEIAAARSILKTTKSAAIREFASKMIADHSTSNVMLQTTSRNAHVMLTSRGRAMIAMAGSLHDAMASGGPFPDRAYLRGQIAAHEDALAVVSAYAAKGSNPLLRTYASNQASVVEAHLALAQNDLATMPAAPRAGASVAPIGPGGVEQPGRKHGGEIAPNASPSPNAVGPSSSPNPLPSTGLQVTPAPIMSTSPHP